MKDKNDKRIGIINELATRIHATAIHQGFWPINDGDKINIDRKILLAVSELTEAQASMRIGNIETDWKSFDRDLKIFPNDFMKLYDKYIKDSFADEIADCVIRCLDLLYGMGYDAGRHIIEKMEYNKQRPYRYGKKF